MTLGQGNKNLSNSPKKINSKCQVVVSRRGLPSRPGEPKTIIQGGRNSLFIVYWLENYLMKPEKVNFFHLSVVLLGAYTQTLKQKTVLWVAAWFCKKVKGDRKVKIGSLKISRRMQWTSQWDWDPPGTLIAVVVKYLSYHLLTQQMKWFVPALCVLNEVQCGKWLLSCILGETVIFIHAWQTLISWL